jgi:cellulose synthase (UDP-forming)
MSVSHLKPKSGLKASTQLQTATLILVAILILSGILVAGWFAGEHRISQLFEQANTLQQHPPMWLQVPMVTGKYLLVPTVALFIGVLTVMRASPQPRVWSRRIVVGILIVLTLRYIVWRSLSTLNLVNPLNGVFSLGLFAFEMLMLASSTIQLFLMVNVKDRKRAADIKSAAVIDGSYNPTVDIFIPTYSEPTFILQRTIIGCQALDYPNKKIYLLDDTRRPEMAELAAQLQCEYITRPDNLHAKAGNINHALTKTSGELIVIFDADFIPTTNFLTRTVGFFQDSNIALVQTPQSFYNSDPIARNLGLENILTSEEEVFYRQIQPIRDGVDSVVCAGTSFVVRRSALLETGGFVTESLSEDYFTGIRLSASGYRLIYLDEKLSAGLAAENIAAHATQRLRWARGTLQGFFIKSNPLTIPGLSLIQRLAHLEGLLHWFTSISRVYFLLMPLMYSFLGVIPIQATPAELMYFFLPYYLVNLAVFAWLNNQARSALLSDIYSLVLCFPLALTVIQVMLNPFSKGFKVTPKGTTSKSYMFNWKLASPLIILFIATAVSLWRNLGMCMIQGVWAPDTNELAYSVKGLGLGWLWSAYNLIMIGIALLILLDAPKPDIYEWFDLRRVVKLNIGNQTFWGVTTIISEAGAEIALTQTPIDLTESTIQLEIAEENLQLGAEIVQIGFNNEYRTIRVKYTSVSLTQHCRIVKMLFCRPGQWKRNKTPGEFQSLLLIFRILLRPRIVFDRNIDLSPVAVTKI